MDFFRLAQAFFLLGTLALLIGWTWPRPKMLPGDIAPGAISLWGYRQLVSTCRGPMARSVDLAGNEFDVYPGTPCPDTCQTVGLYNQVNGEFDRFYLTAPRSTPAPQEPQ